jgi:hypothetical protein
MNKGIGKIKNKMKRTDEMSNFKAQNPNEIKTMSNSKV